MGVTTSFFSATIEQLEAAAPGWPRAEYGEAFEGVGINPFTGERMGPSRGRELLTAAPASCPPDQIHTLIKPDRAFAWSLMGDELEPLMRRITKTSEEEIEKLKWYALVAPSHADNWVFQIPDCFVQALAALDPADMPRVAKAWQKDLDRKSTPTKLLAQIVEVAREAVAANHRMFSYVSL